LKEGSLRLYLSVKHSNYVTQFKTAVSHDPSEIILICWLAAHFWLL